MFFLSGSPSKNPAQISLLHHTCFMHCTSHPAYLIFRTISGEVHKWWSSSIRNFFQSAITAFLLGTNTFLLLLLPLLLLPLLLLLLLLMLLLLLVLLLWHNSSVSGPRCPQFSFLRLHSLMSNRFPSCRPHQFSGTSGHCVYPRVVWFP